MWEPGDRSKCLYPMLQGGSRYDLATFPLFPSESHASNFSIWSCILLKLLILSIMAVLMFTACQGAEGVAGPSGKTGPQGEQGTQGIEGPAGTQGERGEQGERGGTGPAGARGTQGGQGPKGDATGVTGPQGPKGETGPMGAQGAQGPRGLPGETPNYANAVANIGESIVTVATSGWSGTGFFVAPSCSVVTARHLLERITGGIDQEADVTLPSGQVVKATLDYELAAKDIAILKPNRAVDCRELEFSDASLMLGQTVIIVGDSSLSIDSPLTASPGHIINVGTDTTVDFVVLGFVSAGGSGSPVLDVDGNVIGLVWGQWTHSLDYEGQWVFSDQLVAAIHVAKHLR